MIVWLVIGLALGMGAKILEGGLDLSSCAVMLFCGAGGAVLFGYMTSQLLGWSDQDGYFAMAAAFCGGLALLWVANVLDPRRRFW